MDTSEDVPQAAMSFSQLLDRGLALPPARAHWCPTMDLLAVLTSDGQLHLYRLNWQRLWSITPESPITCLCWRPDGKQIAVGQHNGSVLLLNTEDGETQEQAKIFEDPVDAITWTFSSSKTSPGQPIMPYTDRTRKFFEPPLPPAPAHTAPTSAGFDNYAERLGKREDASWPPKLDVMSLIGCGSSIGEIALCGEGLFELAKHRIFKSRVIYQMAIPPSLAEIAIRWITEAGDEVLSLIDISFLAGPAQYTLRMLCSYTADITKSIRTCRTVAWQMWKEWQNVQTAMNEFKSTLNELLKQHGVESDAQSDLLLLVTMGEYTPPMEQFLMNALGEAGIKKIARSVDASLCAMHALLVDRLQPEIEMVAFRLSELCGIAANPMNRKLLNLRVSEVAKAEKSAMDLLSHLETLRERVTQGVSQYRTFFSWLTTALRRFPEDTVDTMMGYPLSHVDAVRTFLHYEFSTSLIEPYIFSEDPKVDHLFDPEVETILQGPDLNIGIEGDNYDFWRDEVKENNDYCENLLKLIEEQFEFESKIEKESVKEAEYEAGLSEENRAFRRCSLSRIYALEKLFMQALLRPPAAMSRRLYTAPTGRAETAHWIFVRQQPSTSDGTTPTSVNEEKNTSASAGGGGVASPGPSNVLPGVLQYNADSGELTVALLIEVAAVQGSNMTQKCQRCLAIMTCTPQKYSENPIFLEPTTTKEMRAAKPNSNIATREAKFIVTPFPEGHDVVDIGYYKDGALALLLETQGSAHGGSGGGDAILALAPRDLYIDTLLPVDIAQINGMLPVFEVYGGHISPPLDLQGCRQRELPYRHSKKPMAISATRGIAFVFTGNQRAILYDLEEDEEIDEEEGEEEQQEEDGGAGGGGEEASMATAVVEEEEKKEETPPPQQFAFRQSQQQVLVEDESDSDSEEERPLFRSHRRTRRTSR